MQTSCNASEPLTEQDVEQEAKAEVEKALHCYYLGQDEPWVPDAGPVEHQARFELLCWPHYKPHSGRSVTRESTVIHIGMLLLLAAQHARLSSCHG